MKIKEVIPIIKLELLSGRTPKGLPLTDIAKESLSDSIEDTKNIDVEAIRCLNCGIIISSLLVSDGCINCGGIDMSTKIEG